MDEKNALPLPRGIRNNNPGNIRHSSAAWLGMSAKKNDSSFVSFDTAVHGIRALAVILLNYQSRHHIDTIEEIITRWAPPTENNTRAYVAVVSRAAKINKDKVIELSADKELFARVIGAIIDHENGNPQVHSRASWYDATTIRQAIVLAEHGTNKANDRSRKHELIVSSHILKRGQKGAEIGVLQKQLNVKGANLRIDNSFGGKTESAVKDVQRKYGFHIDGKVGPATRKVLGMSLSYRCDDVLYFA